MKKSILILGLLVVAGGAVYFMQKNEAPVVINEPIIGSLKDIETNKGFIRSIDNVNGKYYAKIDPTEKESCVNSEGGDCEENTKNTDYEVFSFPVSSDVKVSGFTCYADENVLPVDNIQILQNEINNFPDSECGTYATQTDWDNLLYLFTFNTAGEITVIKSDPVYNQ